MSIEKHGSFGEAGDQYHRHTEDKIKEKLTSEQFSPSSISSSIRLPIKVIGERADRMLEILTNKLDLSKDEMAIVKTALMSTKVINQQSPQDVEREFNFSIKEQGISKKRAEEISDFLKKKVLPAVSKYEISGLESIKRMSPSTSKTEPQELNLQKRYEKGEEIPQYILEFDTNAKHTTNVEGYLDVRIARKTRDSMQFVQKQPGKNVEIFIGSREDLIRYYSEKGFKTINMMKSWTSNEFFYVEDPNDPTNAKIVLYGAGNQSKLNHQLLQLKFVGIDLNKVQIRGTFEDYLAEQLQNLDQQIKLLDPPPSVVFMGNRGLIMTELAQKLYPEQMEDISDPVQREERAEELLVDNGFRTIQVGSFKFSYAKVKKEDGTEVGIMGMRMPNGSLAYDATKICCQNGLKQLITVGAGGSFGEHNAGLGTYQMITRTQYLNDTISFDPEKLLDIKFEAFNKQLIPNISHVTVDSVLVETKEWFHGCKDEGTNSVDVETFHIFKATEEFGKGVKVLPGLFTSDILGGKESLEAKIDVANAWKHMGPFLKDVYEAVLV